MPRSARNLSERAVRGLRRRANWSQLARFAIVGASGYIINLGVFSAFVDAAHAHYLPAAALAFCVAVSNNFLLNRYWTFKATHVTAAVQAPRFLAVSLGALGLNLAALEMLIAVFGLPATVAQAIAIALATPVSFAGNKLWSFSTPAELST
jgi:dolichol-phosphate mannosyltransferase